MLGKFFKDYVSYQLSNILGGKNYSKWSQQTLALQKNIPIKNKRLALELEQACQKNGFLTYAEFLTIDQFGKYGYHATHREHGMTDVMYRWPEALAVLCKNKGFQHIVEFGPGNGKVGQLTIQKAKKLHHQLFWSGVEISEGLREETKNLFRKDGLEKQLLQLVSSLQELVIREKCLFVFSYSIDNLIPEVFVNTSQEKNYPNALVGVVVKNGLLSEILLSEKGIQKTGTHLKNNVYQDVFGISWNLRQWQLNYMQRVYIPLHACKILLNAIGIVPFGSQILIIDEFRASSQKQTYHVGLPRDIETFSRDFIDFRKFYQTAGSNLLYFPPFIDAITSLLFQSGFTLEENTGERTLAYRLSGRNGPLPKRPRAFALLTSPKETEVTKKHFVFTAPAAYF